MKSRLHLWWTLNWACLALFRTWHQCREHEEDFHKADDDGLVLKSFLSSTTLKWLCACPEASFFFFFLLQAWGGLVLSTVSYGTSDSTHALQAKSSKARAPTNNWSSWVKIWVRCVPHFSKSQQTRQHKLNNRSQKPC